MGQNDVEGSFLDPATLSDPYDFYRQLHERCPVYQVPDFGFYMVDPLRRRPVRTLPPGALLEQPDRDHRRPRHDRRPAPGDPARARLGTRRDPAAHRSPPARPLPPASEPGLHPQARGGAGRRNRRGRERADRWLDRRRALRLREPVRDAHARNHHRRAAGPGPRRDPHLQALGGRDDRAGGATADGRRDSRGSGDRARGAALSRRGLRRPPRPAARGPHLGPRARACRGRRRAAHGRRAAEP